METVSTGEQPVKRYDHVNGAWPCEPGKLPKPTGPEAIAGTRLLLAEGFRLCGAPNMARQKRTFRLTSGRRHTWPRSGVWHVNPDEDGHGWAEIVHSVSHWCHQKRFPGNKGHGGSHAFIEKHLIEHVVSRGWLDGKLRRPERVKKVRDVRTERHQRAIASLARWTTKKKRADTAIKKLTKQVRYYERQALN